MNILYVGPYRLNNNIGYESLNILLELYDKYSNIISRPVYINGITSNKLDNVSSLIQTIENNTFDNIDLIIQHLDVESMVYNSRIQKNIYIPFTNNILPCTHQIQKYKYLNQYGIFLYKNSIENYILDHAGVSQKQKIDIKISPKLTVKTYSRFDFGLYNKYTKYYSIIDTRTEKSIKDLIINFIVSFQKENICLVLFIQNMTNNLLAQYNEFIKNVYKNLDINFSINKIILVPVELNNNTIQIMHNTCDVYIDLNNDINGYYAFKNDKPVIRNCSEIECGFDQDNLSQKPLVCYSKKIDITKISSNPVSATISTIINNYVQ